MTKGQFALVSIIGFLVLVAVVFLVLAPSLGYANIIEMFKAWAGNKPQTTPPAEDIVETVSNIVKIFKI